MNWCCYISVSNTSPLPQLRKIHCRGTKNYEARSIGYFITSSGFSAFERHSAFVSNQAKVKVVMKMARRRNFSIRKILWSDSVEVNKRMENDTSETMLSSSRTATVYVERLRASMPRVHCTMKKAKARATTGRILAASGVTTPSGTVKTFK